MREPTREQQTTIDRLSFQHVGRPLEIDTGFWHGVITVTDPQGFCHWLREDGHIHRVTGPIRKEQL